MTGHLEVMADGALMFGRSDGLSVNLSLTGLGLYTEYRLASALCGANVPERPLEDAVPAGSSLRV
jgi:hypothetical protein